MVGRWAVKVPQVVEWRLFLLGLLANMQEVRFSTMRHERLCPVLWSLPGGFLLVMPRCTPLSAEEYCAELVELMDWPLPVENKVDSVGRLDGRIVAVDYGN